MRMKKLVMASAMLLVGAVGVNSGVSAADKTEIHFDSATMADDPEFCERFNYFFSETCFIIANAFKLRG